MVLVEDPRDRVIAAHSSTTWSTSTPSAATHWWPGREGAAGFAALQDEHAIVGQMASGVLEAADLVLLREQVPDRVVDEVDQAVGTLGADARHVADGHLDPSPPGFSRIRSTMSCDSSMPSTGRRRGKRQGDASRAHGELQRLPPAREPGEERDGLLLVPSRVFGVVAQRRIVSEAGLGSNPSMPGRHRGSSGCRATIRQLPSGCRRETIVPRPDTSTRSARRRRRRPAGVGEGEAVGLELPDDLDPGAAGRGRRSARWRHGSRRGR